jgi:hypothetical protein
MTITPEVAERWLEKNTNNRRLNKPLDDRTVLGYAHDMKLGRWHLTGEPLMFDWNGDLLNGQHRLWACIIAETPFESVVVFGVDPEARIVIDTGKKRTLGNYLTMKTERDAVSLAATINLCFRWDHGNFEGDGTLRGEPMTVNHEDAMEWLTENPQVRESVPVGRAFYKDVRYGRTQAAAAHYLNARVDGVASDEFWRLATTGADLPQGSPILALRRWAANQAVQRRGLPGHLILVYYLKAMQVWRDKKSLRILHVKPGEKIGTWER